MNRYVAFLFLLIFGVGYAQSLNSPPKGKEDILVPADGKEYAMTPIPETDKKELMADGKGIFCGKYFYINQPNATGRYAETLFAIVVNGKPKTMLWGFDTIATILDPAKAVPTATYSSKKKPGFGGGWTIKLSAKDITDSQACIADPERK
jgi:hypothetical protein